MKVVIQRVKCASVSVSEKQVGSIDNGLMLLVGFTDTDNVDTLNYVVKKISNLRIFDDKDGIMNLSIKDIKGNILSISQFTLYGDTSKGNRPSYINAMKGEQAIKLYDKFNELLRTEGIDVQTGVFGADMKVSLTNDGPVTIIIER